MKDTKLKKMSRTKLLEILLNITNENDEVQQEIMDLQSQVEALSVKMEDRELNLRSFGSITSAAAEINGIFEAAEQEAAEYLDALSQMEGKRKEECRKIIEEASECADNMIKSASDHKEHTINEADGRWNKIAERLEDFTNNHEFVSRMLFHK